MYCKSVASEPLPVVHGGTSNQLQQEGRYFCGKRLDSLDRSVYLLAIKRAHNKDDIVRAGPEIISVEVEPVVLAESIVASFEGALLRAKVKKSVEPLKNFIHL